MREIVKDTGRLRELAATGDGVVHNPFDKRMHAAGCATVRERMRATPDSPVWFFSSQAEARDFLAGHVERYPTATWQVARCCVHTLRDEARPAPSPVTRIAPAPSKRAARNALIVEADNSSIAAWSDHDVRNETRADSPGGRLRGELCDWLRTGRARAGQLLEAAYAGERRNGADVENLLFNNIDQAAGAYRAACAAGLRFSWLGPSAPPHSTGAIGQYYYRYRFVSPSASLPGVLLRDWARRWSQVPLLEGLASRPGSRMSTRVWWSLRHCQPERQASLQPGSTFAIRLVLHGEGADPATALKGSLDGVVAALEVQRNRSAAAEAARILAGDRPGDAIAILRLLTEHDDPALGSVDRLVVPVAARHGRDVRWDPADSGCIAGEVLVGERHGSPRIDVDVLPCELEGHEAT